MGAAGFRVLAHAVSVLCRKVAVHNLGSVQGSLEA
jgi:hypothetical protein